MISGSAPDPALQFAFGSFLVGPLSEIYGRVVLLHTCNIIFVCFTVGCALAPSLGSLIVLRFLSGIFASCTVTVDGGYIADITTWEAHSTAVYQAIIVPIISLIAAPAYGSILSATKDWREGFGITTTYSAFGTLIMLIFMRKETYAPVRILPNIMALV